MMLIAWLRISKSSMDNSVILLFIIAAFTSDKCHAGICTDGGVTVATITQRKVELGTKQSGFKITCNYTIDSGYDLSLWRVQTTTVDYVLTHVPPSTVAAGTGYATRGLTFVDNQAVDFPDYIQSDVAKQSFTCYLALKSNTIFCTDDREQNIFALPDVTIVSTPDLANPVPLNTNVSLDITGANYLCDVTPTFNILIGSLIIPLNVSPVTNPDGFQTFNTSASFLTTTTGSMTAFMECNGDNATIIEPIQITVAVDDECLNICIGLAVLIGIGGCGCEVAVLVVTVVVYCMFHLITGADTLIYELAKTLGETELEQKLKHGLKKLKVNHKIDQTGKLRITLQNAEFTEKELKSLISNLKTMEMNVGEKVFPVWAKYVKVCVGTFGSLLGVIGIILHQVLSCLEECLALLILAIIAFVIGALVIIIWIVCIRTWIFYKRKMSNGNAEAGDSPIPLTGSQIHTTPSEKKTPRGEPPKKMLEQKVRSIDELKEIKKKPPPVFKGNGQSQNNPREPSPISQSDSVASSSDVAVHPGKTKVTPTNEPVRM